MAHRYKLGKGETCSLLVEEESISPEHAVFIDCGDYLRIEDISKNGTYLVRHSVRRRLTKHVIEPLRNDDVLFFGYMDQAFDVHEIFSQIKAMRLPVGSQRVRCGVHGIIHMENKRCPLCPP
ncbi:FHA domain-containing protein [Myxococcota bacterium]|nr:FHA domain-containing protein [Myxococcota bacterium]